MAKIASHCSSGEFSCHDIIRLIVLSRILICHEYTETKLLVHFDCNFVFYVDIQKNCWCHNMG